MRLSVARMRPSAHENSLEKGTSYLVALLSHIQASDNICFATSGTSETTASPAPNSHGSLVTAVEKLFGGMP